MTDFNDDPLGYLAEKTQALEQQVAAASAVNIAKEVAASERALAQADPAYFAAVNHVREARMRELMANGASEDAARQQFQNEAYSIAAQAIRAGQDPAALAMEIARRSGFDPFAEPPDSARRFPEFDIRQLQREAAPSPEVSHFDKVFGGR